MFKKMLATCTLLIASQVALADELRVAVAANLAAPMQVLAAEFERSSGHKLLLSMGATGKFYAQIKNGAPFDVLLAADSDTPSKLAQEGLALGSTQFTYATGKLVLWAPATSTAASSTVDGAAVLRQGDFDRLSMANPQLAPYGLAALQTLQALGVYNALKGKLVQGENISQAHQFVLTGNAQWGLIALSQVMEEGRIQGRAWLVPSHLYSPIQQDAIVLKNGAQNPAAAALMAFLQTPATRNLLQSYGYEKTR